MAVQKLYALQAQGDRGKSTTLKLLILHILETYHTVLQLPDGEIMDAATLRNRLIAERHKTERDGVRAEIETVRGTIRVGKTTVAVNSAGNRDEDVIDSIELFDGNADIGFCAVRTKGDTINRLNEFAAVHKLRDGVDYFVICKLALANVGNCKKNPANLQQMNEMQAGFLFNAEFGMRNSE